MSFLTGDQKHSWQPIMTVETATKSYWLNWRVLLCSIWVMISLFLIFFLIGKFEGSRKSKNDQVIGQTKKKPEGLLYEDEVWRPCLKSIHPGWLLGFRVFAFVVLLMLLVATSLHDGSDIFYFYTQWTFTLITIYFGLGSLLSVIGCYRYHKKGGGNSIDNERMDSEHNAAKNLSTLEECRYRKTAGLLGYFFQIIFQMNAGAVILTDTIFWFIMVPFLEMRDYKLNFLIINMHSINAVFLLGDTALNSLRFPWFRIAYFFLWTTTFVIFQWIVHACVSLWWPYPFLDLSSSFSPLWYASVALMHFPCYGIFALIMKLKHHLLSKWFPDSYQYVE